MMISTIESTLALTILDQTGERLRVPRGVPAYDEVKALLVRKDLTSAKIFELARTLVVDSLAATMSWASRFGVTLERTAHGLALQGMLVGEETWVPFLERLLRTGGTPVPAVHLARQLGDEVPSFKADKVCAVWTPATERAEASLGFAVLRPLPAAARIGDSVANVFATAGPCFGLVSSPVHAPVDRSLVKGKVLVIGDKSDLQDILSEPVILGFNRTYRCEEASEAGWLEDMSFDSLSKAIENLKEIRLTGSEARLVNRISGSVLSV